MARNALHSGGAERWPENTGVGAAPPQIAVGRLCRAVGVACPPEADALSSSERSEASEDDECGREDLNLHPVARTSTSSWRVYLIPPRPREPFTLSEPDLVTGE